MNTLEKFLAVIGLTSDRFEKMSQAEQANLRTLSDTQSNLEQDRNQAISERDQAHARITELESQVSELAAVQEQLTQAQADLVTAHDTITALGGQIIDLNAKLEKKPAAPATPIVGKADESEKNAGKTTEEKPKYWTSADQALADFHSKFTKK